MRIAAKDVIFCCRVKVDLYVVLVGGKLRHTRIRCIVLNTGPRWRRVQRRVEQVVSDGVDWLSDYIVCERRIAIQRIVELIGDQAIGPRGARATGTSKTRGRNSVIADTAGESTNTYVPKVASPLRCRKDAEFLRR